MQHALLTLLMITLLLQAACTKRDVGDCLKSTGKIIREERSAGNIDFIYLQNNINLILTQDSLIRVTVEAGENIIDDIRTEYDQGRFYISNENSCNWVRSYSQPVNVYLNVPSVDSIEYHGSGNITGTGALTGDSIKIDIWEGSGSIQLDIHMGKSRLYFHYGTADLNITGFSGVAYIYAASYGPVHCENMNSKFVYINNRGTNDCFVRATEILEATIEYMGNIYYYGDPKVVISNITGSGQLIRKD